MDEDVKDPALANGDDGDEDVADAGDADASIARRGKRSTQRPATLLKRKNSKHLVESSLDEFVAKARGNVVDVSSFVPDTREQTLAREVEELRQKLANAEARI